MAKHLWIFCGLIAGLNLLAMEDDKNPPQNEAREQILDNPLSSSVIDKCVDSVTSSFSSCVKLHEKDHTLPLIGHLVTNNNVNAWQGLIIYGFSKQQFNSEDLKWVIREFSRPSYLGKEAAKNLFRLILDKNLLGDRGTLLIDLLTAVNIKKEDYLSDKNKEWLGADSHTEMRNLLIDCVENGYLEAFKIILETFPQLVNKLITDNAVTRQENPTRNDPKAWIYYNYNYTAKNYTLLDWLKRNHNGTPLAYLNRNWGGANEYYIGAARIILTMAVTVLDTTDAVYDMKQILYKQGDISEDLEASVSAKFSGKAKDQEKKE